MPEPFDGVSIAEQLIAEEAVAQTGSLNLGSLGLTELPPTLFTLRHLRMLDLGSGSLMDDGHFHYGASFGSSNRPHNQLAAHLDLLSKLPHLHHLSVVATDIVDLTPLAGISTLRTLDCCLTQVSDLRPLKPLTALQNLYCSRTSVSDLTPLASLTALEALSCSCTPITDLAPLTQLTALQSLYCSETKVSDLAPLATLTALQTLDCSYTPISDLAPLTLLTELQNLDCSETKVSDLAPLVRLTALQSLRCNGTQVSDLTPLTPLTALQDLDFAYTKVSDLAPLAELDALQSLNCNGCPVISLPKAIPKLPQLKRLQLKGCHIPDIPAEVLFQEQGDNCLESVRAHIRDLEAGSVPATDVKLIVLGNGRVGKTQICRRLRREGFDPAEASTHGILVTSADLDTGAADKTRLNIWDFGGQDLYHGTHALFLRTSAVFLAVWAKETEDTDTHTHQGIVFRNQRLPYWLAYIRHLAAADSPVVIVQARCDQPRDQALFPPVEAADTQAFAQCVTVAYSALNDRNRPALNDALREAVASLREGQATTEIGIGRMHVLRALQHMRDADMPLPPEQRRHRTLTQTRFRELCDRAGNVSSPEQLLRYLHNAGTVFYQDGLFGDQIVLDQAWALDAIYAVFNREKCSEQLKRLRGRFSRPLLDALVWGKHTESEQKLFLDMMQSCGICFPYRRNAHETEVIDYIAPDLLPERPDIEAELAARWDPSLPSEQEDIPFEMLHPGLVRGLICEIGAQAGATALYWRGGVEVYDTVTGSHALIEQRMADGWHGSIRIQTQKGQAALLLERLADWVERRSGRDGLQARRIRKPIRAEMPEPETTDKLPANPASAPVEERQYYVSYAWGDDATPEGREREEIVDRLYVAALAHRQPIIRDKTALSLGDDIIKFMRRIAAGDRVFVILSDKYLRSPWCMFELYETWRYSRGEEADFLRRVRTFSLPGTEADSIEKRMAHGDYWKRRYDGIAAAIKRDGGATIGKRDFAAFKHMGEFYSHIGDILEILFGRVQPRTFEDLEAYGFDDPPA